MISKIIKQFADRKLNRIYMKDVSSYVLQRQEIFLDLIEFPNDNTKIFYKFVVC